VEYRNPEFLKTLTGGVPFQIDGNEAKSITIPAVVR
jgi:hypothetical protein